MEILHAGQSSITSPTTVQGIQSTITASVPPQPLITTNPDLPAGSRPSGGPSTLNVSNVTN